MFGVGWRVEGGHWGEPLLNGVGLVVIAEGWMWVGVGLVVYSGTGGWGGRWVVVATNRAWGA